MATTDPSEMTPYQYMLYQYEKFGIKIDAEYRAWKKNPHQLPSNELWWNSVSLEVPHTRPDGGVGCSQCEKDLRTYNDLKRQGRFKKLKAFDTSESKLRKCTQATCFWSEYYKSRRI